MDDDQDGDGVFQVRGEEPTCPCCQKVMARGAMVCPACSHDQHARQTFEPLAKRWEPGLSYLRRIRIFLVCQGLGLLSLLLAAVMGELGAALVSWFFFTALLTCLLGTYYSVELTRNQRGRVALTKIWSIAFVRMSPIKLRLGDFEGVAIGKDRDPEMWDWIVLCGLLLFALIPGIIWWYLAIRGDRGFVALTRDHGAPAYWLYRGTNEELMAEMSCSIREVAFPALELPSDARH
jgi:hypothetical protein